MYMVVTVSFALSERSIASICKINQTFVYFYQGLIIVGKESV